MPSTRRRHHPDTPTFDIPPARRPGPRPTPRRPTSLPTALPPPPTPAPAQTTALSPAIVDARPPTIPSTVIVDIVVHRHHRHRSSRPPSSLATSSTSSSTSPSSSLVNNTIVIPVIVRPRRRPSSSTLPSPDTVRCHRTRPAPNIIALSSFDIDHHHLSYAPPARHPPAYPQPTNPPARHPSTIDTLLSHLTPYTTDRHRPHCPDANIAFLHAQRRPASSSSSAASPVVVVANIVLVTSQSNPPLDADARPSPDVVVVAPSTSLSPHRRRHFSCRQSSPSTSS